VGQKGLWTFDNKINRRTESPQMNFMITVARYWLLDNKNSANIRMELKIKYCYTDKRISNNVIPTFQSKKNPISQECLMNINPLGERFGMLMDMMVRPAFTTFLQHLIKKY
jgi:hypothetical protein